MPAPGLRGSDGVAFLVSAGVVMEAIAAYCSSPQTTEINADKRADTLMKWVGVGLGVSAVLVGIAAYIEPAERVPIIVGGGISGAALGLSYVYAKQSGLKNGGASTESY